MNNYSHQRARRALNAAAEGQTEIDDNSLTDRIEALILDLRSLAAHEAPPNSTETVVSGELRANGYTASRTSTASPLCIEVLDRDRFIIGCVATFEDAERVMSQHWRKVQ